MKLVVLKSHLRDAISAVERASAENASVPVLRNVLIAAGDGEVKLSATNLEIGVTASCAAKVIESGAASVPATLFAGIIGNLQSERLNLELSGSGLEVTTDNYRASVQTLPADEFPPIPTIEGGDGFSIPSAVLVDSLGRVSSSAQQSDIRPELSSVLFSFADSELRFAATDSFRLAEKTIPGSSLGKEPSEDLRILVPVKTALEVIRMFRAEEEIEVRYDAHQVLFSGKNASLISRLVGGTFPDYQPRVPREFATEVVVDPKEFLAAIRLTGVVGGRSGEISLRADGKSRSVEISSSDQGVGENSCMVPAKVSGVQNTVSFNWRYLADGVKVVDGEELFLGLNDGSKPALMRSPRDGSFYYIVMPIMKP